MLSFQTNDKKPQQQNNLQNTNKTNISKLVILADSHGMNLGHLIEQRTSLSVCSHVKPNAKFYDVVLVSYSTDCKLLRTVYIMDNGDFTVFGSQEIVAFM